MTSSLLLRAALIFGGILTLSGCGAAPAPAPLPPPPPAAVPVAPPLAADWRDWPVAAGDWSYRAVDGGSVASFGGPGQSAQMLFRCDSSTHSISVSRAAREASGQQIVGQMKIRTSSGDAQWPVLPGGVPGAATSYAVATRAAIDGAFDAIIYSRGRFAIEAPGAQPIAVPIWAEVARVIEDCRG